VVIVIVVVVVMVMVVIVIVVVVVIPPPPPRSTEGFAAISMTVVVIVVIVVAITVLARFRSAGGGVGNTVIAHRAQARGMQVIRDGTRIAAFQTRRCSLIRSDIVVTGTGAARGLPGTALIGTCRTGEAAAGQSGRTVMARFALRTSSASAVRSGIARART